MTALPDLVCVPAHPDPGFDADDPGTAEPRVRIEMRRHDGEMAGVVFSSLDRLVAQLGRAQPWMVMDSQVLAACLARIGVNRIVLDPDLSGSPGRWTTDDVSRLAGGSDE